MSAPFSSENPPPEVEFFRLSQFLIILSSDTDNFLSYKPRGFIPKLLPISFFLVVMKTPNPGDLISHLIRKGQFPMMLKIREPLQWRHSFQARSGLMCLGNLSLRSLARLPLSHLLAGVAENDYTPLLNGPILSLMLIR
jgi:hypothetical protein